MPSRADEQLARVLAARFEPEELAVYADYLQSLGDPRGELIAIDLADSPELAARRAEIEATWFTALPPELRATAQSHVGFAELVVDDVPKLIQLRDALSGSVAPFVRRVTIVGSADMLGDGIANLAQAPRPALDTLTIHHTGDIPREPIVATGTARDLVAATPRLTRLVIDGRNVMREFDHPYVTALEISGLDALGNLSGDGAPLTSVVELDFAFHRNAILDHLPAPDDRLVRSLLPAARLPALGKLDLSRNEPGSRGEFHRGGQTDIFAWLRASDLRVAHLRLPSLRSDRQAADLLAIQQRMPDSVIELARNYAYGPPVPAGVVAPPPRPWPPRDEIHGRDALSIDVPGHPYGEDVDLVGAVDMMESSFDALAPAARDAWSELWAFLPDLGWEDADGNDIVMQFSAAVLVAALEPLDLSNYNRWSDLRTMLRQSTPLPDDVSIKRYWGW